MMNSDRLRELLAREEGENLEFKQTLNLDTKAGRAKFLKVILSLANCQTSSVSNMVVGVEDKSKRLIGVRDIAEERLQEIIASNCRPPLRVEVHTVKYEGVDILVVQISRRHNFYVLNSPLKDENDKVISNKAVFVRRGSVVDEATPEEIVEMALNDTPDFTAIVSGLDNIRDSVAEIAYQMGHLSMPRFPRQNEYSKTLEMILIGMICGGVLVYFWPNIGYPVLYPLTLFVIALTSSIGWTHFGIFRALGTTLLLPVILGGFFLQLEESVILGMSLSSIPILRYGFGATIGAITGLVSAWVATMFEGKFRG